MNHTMFLLMFFAAAVLALALRHRRKKSRLSRKHVQWRSEWDQKN